MGKTKEKKNTISQPFPLIVSVFLLAFALPNHPLFLLVRKDASTSQPSTTFILHTFYFHSLQSLSF